MGFNLDTAISRTGFVRAGFVDEEDVAMRVAIAERFAARVAARAGVATVIGDVTVVPSSPSPGLGFRGYEGGGGDLVMLGSSVGTVMLEGVGGGGEAFLGSH